MAMAKKYRAACYLRCSTKQQDTSIADQKSACIDYAKRNAIEIVQFYEDEGISGDSTKKRAAFLQMLGDVDSGQFNAILCWNQERFGRFDSIEAGHWIFPLREAGVVLITTNEGVIDWNSYLGRVSFSLKQEGAHEHSVKLSNDVLRGQIAAAKNGSWIGSAPYAYRITGTRKEKRLEIDDDEKVAIVQRIFREYVEEGRSLNSIAKRLTAEGFVSPGGHDHWRYDRIREILANPAYIGTFVYNRFSSAKYHTFRDGQITVGASRGRNSDKHWIVKPNNHEAIVDESTFIQAQQILERGKSGRNQYQPENNPYLFTGILRCGRCNSVLHGFKSSTGKHRYECSKRKEFISYGVGEPCEGTTVGEDELIDMVTGDIEDQFFNMDTFRDLKIKAKQGTLSEKDLPQAFLKLKEMVVADTGPKVDIQKLKRRIAAIDVKLSKAKRNLALASTPTSFTAVEEEIGRMELQKEELRQKLTNQPTEAGINAMVLDIIQKIAMLAYPDPDSIVESIRPALLAIKSIEVGTTITGKGSGRRHSFGNAYIEFREVGGVTGKVNPQHPWF